MKYLALKNFLLHGSVIDNGSEIDLDDNDYETRSLLSMGRIIAVARVEKKTDQKLTSEALKGPKGRKQ